MESFNQFSRVFTEEVENASLSVLEEAINTHSTHIEDYIFKAGKEGLKGVLEGLSSITKSLEEKEPSRHLSTKIDGCVHGDTLVVTTKGPKAIKSLTNDDFVATLNPKSKKIEFVSNTIPRGFFGSKKWVKVLFKNRGNVICTEDHPFLEESLHYRPAGKLSKRTRLFPLDEKERVVISVKPLKEKFQQFDLTTKNENFIISVGGTNVVIHNSPAVFLIRGENGFAVATKSLFNKTNPKINYTIQDIEKNHEGSLGETLKEVLKYFSKITPRNPNKVYQGDLLFTEKTKKHFQKDGINLIGFCPNTILYAIGENTKEGKMIESAKIGLAIHTEYDWDGVNPSTLRVSKYGIRKDEFTPSKDVFLIDTVSNLVDNGARAVSASEVSKIHDTIRDIQKLEKSLDWKILKENPEFALSLVTFVNSYIRENRPYPETDKMVFDYGIWMGNQIKAEQNKRKTEKGKQAVFEKYNPFIEYAGKNTQNVLKLFSIFKKITSAKLALVKSLEKYSPYQKFVTLKTGELRNTGSEGYVLTDTGAKGTKLVNRLEFSLLNFSDKVQKGWEK